MADVLNMANQNYENLDIKSNQCMKITDVCCRSFCNAVITVTI